MTVSTDNTVSGSGSASGTTTTPGYSFKTEDFIKMFLAQIKHQNPMQPTDSSAILNQMAQIGSIQASSDMQKKMDSMANSVQSSMMNTQFMQATNLVGRSVQLESAVSQLKQGKPMVGSVEVVGATANVQLTITDPATGQIVKTMDLGASNAPGLKTFTWDGTDSDGNPLPDNFYKINATASINGKIQDLPTIGSFNVNSVALDQDAGVILNLDYWGGKTMDQIVKVN